MYYERRNLCFVGAIIGGSVSLLGTYLTLRQGAKMELKKLSLSFLMEKKTLIEGLINTCSSFEYNGNMEEDEGTVIDEYEVILAFMYKKSHYFVESNEFQKLQNNLSDIFNDKYHSTNEISYYKGYFNRDARKFFQNELESVMRDITKKLQ